MSSRGESASPGVSSPGLPALEATLAGILPLALASGCGGVGTAFSAGLAAGLAAVFAAGLTAAALFVAGFGLCAAFLTCTGRAGACFFAGFACFLAAVLVATRHSTR